VTRKNSRSLLNQGGIVKRRHVRPSEQSQDQKERVFARNQGGIVKRRYVRPSEQSQKLKDRYSCSANATCMSDPTKCFIVSREYHVCKKRYRSQK
jgi:hypothetical protein